MQDRNSKGTYPEHQELAVKEIYLKITLIAKFQKKIPYVLWSEHSYRDRSPYYEYFDLMRVGSLDIAEKHGFYWNDLIGTEGGMNHQTVVLKNDSSIDVQEFTISDNIRKTETEVVIKSISPDIVIKILSEIDRRKFLRNGSEPEDLYIKISPENHPLEDKIKDAYRDAGFNLLQYDPTMTNIKFFLSEAYSAYQLGIFNYAKKAVSDLVVNNNIGPSNPRRTIGLNKDNVENNAETGGYLSWQKKL